MSTILVDALFFFCLSVRGFSYHLRILPDLSKALPMPPCAASFRSFRRFKFPLLSISCLLTAASSISENAALIERMEIDSRVSRTPCLSRNLLEKEFIYYRIFPVLLFVLNLPVQPGLPVAVVQSLSHVWLFATLWTAAHQASLSFTISWSLLKLMSIDSVMPSNHLILCHPLLLSLIFPSIRVFSNELALSIRWPKYWSFCFSPSLSNEYSGLISFRIDWFDLLAVHGTLKSLLQHHNAKASVLWCSAFWFTCGFTSYLEWSFNETAFSCSMHADFSCLRTRTHLSMCLGVLLADFRVPRSALEILKSSILSMLSFFF